MGTRVMEIAILFERQIVWKAPCYRAKLGVLKLKFLISRLTNLPYAIRVFI